MSSKRDPELEWQQQLERMYGDQSDGAIEALNRAIARREARMGQASPAPSPTPKDALSSRRPTGGL